MKIGVLFANNFGLIYWDRKSQLTRIHNESGYTLLIGIHYLIYYALFTWNEKFFKKSKMYKSVNTKKAGIDFTL